MSAIQALRGIRQPVTARAQSANLSLRRHVDLARVSSAQCRPGR